MYEFHPYFTNDGSVGLYNSDFDDIYHSSTGALTEAYEKFILPIDFDKLLQKDSIKILDICYGVGYNSKSFLNFVFEKFCKKESKNFKEKIFQIFKKKSQLEKQYYAQIHTNKIKSKESYLYYDTIDTNKIFTGNYNCIDKIYNDNIFDKISITAIDNDENLAFLSPFVKTGENNFNNDNIDFYKKDLDKYLQNKNKIKPQKINKLINFLILEKIRQNTPSFGNNEVINQILTDKKYAQFFESDIRGIWVGKNINRYINTKVHILSKLNTFLHNIYYHHIANRYKKDLEAYKLDNFKFNLKIDDARKIITVDTNTYNLIFLDAFTPSKCPCLWSYEFLKELHKHLEHDGMLLTYSTSASIRSAMIEAGFFIGNIYNERENKYIGTIATKDKSLIKYELSEFDLGLLKTSAGIFYRDINLTGQNEAIFEARKKEVENTDRISTSQYKKKFNRGKIC